MVNGIGRVVVYFEQVGLRENSDARIRPNGPKGLLVIWRGAIKNESYKEASKTPPTAEVVKKKPNLSHRLTRMTRVKNNSKGCLRIYSFLISVVRVNLWLGSEFP